jgi:uncharacterized protein Yka (UPF0111/DUF47 family)/8-oxo-dGTP pyrophosphatase MutT (NUDIX family)
VAQATSHKIRVDEKITDTATGMTSNVIGHYRGSAAIRQIAALPYRFEGDGSTRIMLITSRGTGRWIVPKGNLIPGLTPHRAAAHEAFEEAGLSGITLPTMIGSFGYLKRLKGGRERATRVEVFPLAVIAQAAEWPEQSQRQTAWFSVADAAAAVAEPELKAIIAGFRATEQKLTSRASALPNAQFPWGPRRLKGRWFEALIRWRSRCLDLLGAHATIIVASAETLACLLEGNGSIAGHRRALAAYKQQADGLARDVLQHMRRNLIFALDRGTVTTLIGSMNDAIDSIYQAAEAIMATGVDELSPAIRDMGDLVVEAARVMGDAVPLLQSVARHRGTLQILSERIVQIAVHSSDIHKAASPGNPEANSIDRRIGREIGQHLAQVVDRIECAANQIKRLVADHA